MKKIVYIFIAVVFITSCTNGQNENNKKSQTKEVYLIPDSLYSFFPNNPDEYKGIKLNTLVTNAEEIDLPYSKQEFAITYLTKVFMYTDTSYFVKKKKELLNLSIKKFNSIDTNYFIIGSERYLLKRYDTLDLKEKYFNIDDSYLMMDFHSIFNNNKDFHSEFTICDLPEDYKILILKSGNEYVLPEKYRNSWEILPEKLKHGYISGAALKEAESIMIYWVVAW